MLLHLPIKYPRHLYLGLLLSFWLWSAGCAQIPALPATVDPDAYTLITCQDLQRSGPANLTSGHRIKLPAYFWQYLSYDPAWLANYPNLLRYPFTWYHLEWFSVYGSSDMQGYYDRLVMTYAQRESYDLKRLDPIMIYGELANLGGGLLYLQVHRIDRLSN
jgi:hypothetical protein